MPAQFFGTLPQQRPWIAEAAGGFGQGAVAGMEARRRAQQEAQKNSLMSQQLGMSGIAQALKQKQFEYNTGPQADINEEKVRIATINRVVEQTTKLPPESRESYLDMVIKAGAVRFKSGEEAATRNFIKNVPGEEPRIIEGREVTNKRTHTGELQTKKVEGLGERKEPLKEWSVFMPNDVADDEFSDKLRDLKSLVYNPWFKGDKTDIGFMKYIAGREFPESELRDMQRNPSKYASMYPDVVKDLPKEKRIEVFRKLATYLLSPDFNDRRRNAQRVLNERDSTISEESKSQTPTTSITNEEGMIKYYSANTTYPVKKGTKTLDREEIYRWLKSKGYTVR